MKVLTCAKSHGEDTIKIPKDIIISFSNKTFNVSKYLKPDKEKEGNLRFFVVESETHLEFKLKVNANIWTGFVCCCPHRMTGLVDDNDSDDSDDSDIDNEAELDINGNCLDLADPQSSLRHYAIQQQVTQNDDAEPEPEPEPEEPPGDAGDGGGRSGGGRGGAPGAGGRGGENIL